MQLDKKKKRCYISRAKAINLSVMINDKPQTLPGARKWTCHQLYVLVFPKVRNHIFTNNDWS